ncbi:MAG: hypothetical protein AAF449_23690, partial [Myxococcota bacterium]
QEEPTTRIAHRVIRTLALGQRGAFIGLRDLLSEKVDGSKGPRSVESIADAFCRGEPHFARLRCTIGPTTVCRPANWPSGAKEIVDRARRRWRTAPEDFHPTWTTTEVSPAPRQMARWHAMFLSTPDPRIHALILNELGET